MRLLLTAALATASLLLAAQNTETRDVKAFSRVAVNYGIDATVVRGDAPGLTLEGDADLLADLRTYVEGGTLKFEYDQSIWDRLTARLSDGAVRATITTPRLYGVVANGGAEVRSAEEWPADAFNVVANGGADVELKIRAIEAKVVANGGADVTLSGTARRADILANGGSDVRARGLTCQRVEAKANGAAEITVHADERLEASANGGSDIRYYGDATDVDVRSNGGSGVERG